MTLIIYNAYRIRMGAIEEFGPVIHEFDPYFNYRATEVRHIIHIFLPCPPPSQIIYRNSPLIIFSLSLSC